MAQENNQGVEFTDIIKFIEYKVVPSDRQVTYDSCVSDCCPLDTTEWRIRLIVGSDKSEYGFDSGSPATGLTYTKILLNRNIHDIKSGARFLV